MHCTSVGLLLVVTTLQLLHLGNGADCKDSEKKLAKTFKTFEKKCLKNGYESTLAGCESQGDPSKLSKKQTKKCDKLDKKLGACEVTCEGEKTTQYTITHETGSGKYDGGSSGGYMFTIIGTKGETSPHDCTAARGKTEIGHCIIDDDADIGQIKEVKIYNSGDDWWVFKSLTVNGYQIGCGSVDDYKTEVYPAYGKDASEYKVLFETGSGQWDGGATQGYMFTIVGTKGETTPHDCVANKAKGTSNGCTFYDNADIGEIKEVKIYNSGDNWWAFTSLTVNGYDVGGGSVDDYKTEVFSIQ